MGCLAGNAPFLVTSLLVTIIVVRRSADLLFRDVNFRFWYVTVARFSDDFTRFFAIDSIRSTLTLLVFFRIECFDPPSKRAM